MNTQYRKNLKAVLEASKSYCDKRIDDLEWQIGTYNYDVATDSNVARIKTLPSDTYKSQVDYIGGKTVKYNQLAFAGGGGYLAQNGTISTSDNITKFTASARNGQLIHGGAPLTANHKYFSIANIKIPNNYVMSFLGGNTAGIDIVGTGNFKQYYRIYTNPYDFWILRDTHDSDWQEIELDNQSVEIIDLTDIFGAGNEPTSVDTAIPLLKANGYKLDGTDTYSTGSLKHAITTSVNFLPINVWDNEIEIGAINSTTGQKENNPSGNYWRSKNYFEVIANQTYFVKQSDGYTTSNANMSIYFYDENYNFIIRVQNVANNTIVIPSNCKYIMFQQFFINATQTTPTGICINISNANYNGNYYPYVAPITKAIPNEVQALDGYGLGISNTLYNYIDLNAKKFKLDVMQILGSSLIGWRRREDISERNTYSLSIPNTYKFIDTVKALSSRYTYGGTIGSYGQMSNKNDMTFCLYYVSTATASSGVIYINDSSCSTASELETAIANETFEFEINTIETDVSQYFTDGWNKVDLDNQYATCEMVVAEPIDMPNSITNLIKEVKA